MDIHGGAVTTAAFSMQCVVSEAEATALCNWSFIPYNLILLWTEGFFLINELVYFHLSLPDFEISNITD